MTETYELEIVRLHTLLESWRARALAAESALGALRAYLDEPGNIRESSLRKILGEPLPDDES